MNLDSLKKGWFGYQKASVYEYIAQIEATYADKLAQQEAAAKETEQGYVERIRRLEEELTQLRQQYEAQRSEQLMVSGALLDAKRYAQTLRQEAEEREAQERRELEAEWTQIRQELALRRDQSGRLRRLLQDLLGELDRQTEDYEDQVEQAQQEMTDCGNLSLFQRSQ